MSKAPTGLTIARNGGTYTASWKCGDKNYDSGQQFQYSINGSAWRAASIGAKARSGSIYINLAGYYPNTGSVLSTVSIRVRGKLKKKKSSWSAWTTRTYTNYVPNVPDLSVSLDEQLTNKCTFTWSLSTSAADAQPYWHVRWETILVKESDVTDGSKLTWNSSQTGWSTGAGSYASSQTITEDTTLLADAGYTRWFRVCARGARGGSAWRYAKHVYARPYQAKIEYAEISETSAEGLTGYARWTADQTESHPIDRTTVQYLITVPNAGLACPSGAQWTDINVSADTSNTDAVRFSIDDRLDKDECLFVRVNTVHDTNITYSEPTLGSVGKLRDPTDLGYQVDNIEHTLTSVSVDNNSDVPDSFIALVYRSGSRPEDEIVVGIIPHGASQPIVTPVQCPDWSGETEFSIGAFAAVGSYEATSAGYAVDVKMRSEATLWVGGAVPVAPESVNVVQSPITGTATVTWDWTWAKATYAQLSWTDHEDAWESTDEPEIYTITRPRATKWNISGLELGKKWFIAVRLVSGNPNDENAIYSPWSDMRDITLSSVPNVPSLNLSARVITEGEEITASWDFVSNDGTGQISAEIKDEDSNLIAHTETQKEVVIDTEALGWSQGEIHSLSVRVTSESNRTTEWSNPVSIVVAEALEGSIAETSLETKTVEVNPRSFEKTDFLSFLTEQEEVFTKLKAYLEPIQDLHGYDAPWVGGSGKNLFKPWSTTYSGITFTPQSNGTVSISGTVDTVGWIRPTKDFTPADLGLSVGDNVYVYSRGYTCTTAFVTLVRFLDSNNTDIGQLSENETGTIPNGTAKIRLYMYGIGSSAPTVGTVIDEVGYFQFGKGSTLPTKWTPYSNICPISGHDGVGVSVASGQLIDTTTNVSGVIDASGNEVANATFNRTDFIPIDKANICLKTSLSSGYVVRVHGYSASKVWVSQITNVTTDGTEMLVEATVPNGVAYIRVSYPLVGIDNTELWQSETYTTTLPSTTYGGTLDLVSGELTVNKAFISLNGTEAGWTKSGTYGGSFYNSRGNFSPTPAINARLLCSHAEYVSSISNYAFGKCFADSAINLWLGQSLWTVDDFKTFLADQNTAGTPVQLCYELATPQTYQLTPQQIQTLLGQNNVWSEQGEVEGRIAEAARDVLSLTQMPLTVKLSGVNSNVTATVTIERTADYHMDRPDETQFDGYEGEIVFLTTQNSNEDIIINQEDLIGLMDDEAPYRAFVTFKDVYGQSMSDSVDFEVHWNHQAIIPEASVEIDEENLIAKLTPIAPTGTLTGDTCDIYRLSADRPELIVKDGAFGTQYVDPYPAIGEFGGHRFVFKTVNGDYITATNDIAWTDTGIEEDDILDFDRTIIDFDGNQLLLYYNVDVGHQWDKDFQQTKYLGGSIQGDWNAGVSRSGSISATMITLTDAEQIRMMRELAVYTGVCHVRTTDGSSYTADVQVSEDRDHDDYGKLASFSLTITRVDAETLDGLTYQQWAEEE